MIEDKLSKKIKNRFFVTSEKDKELGERVVLVLEGTKNNLDASVFDGLDKYEIPKQIYTVENFEETVSGKIQRSKTLELVSK